MSELVHEYFRPEILVFILGMWACIAVSRDSELRESTYSKFLLAAFMVPFSLPWLGICYVLGFVFCSLLAFLAVVLGFPYEYDFILDVLSDRLAGPVSSWIGAIFPWAALALGLPWRVD
ncbi:hypothetical protein [Leisingera daeponensis]|uniref:hypothetical protein n=1 Tax=Leisingera daeponensis TaxID=405746 RepID=UPI001C96B328|nr:hypothetical protein [Leisingera daeponensis]MBY6056776.1 hypothetical protein [Leisingera daeponensis]